MKSISQSTTFTIVLLLILLSMNQTYAQEAITLTTDQAEYYFLIGEQAAIPINVTNPHGEVIEGQLSYTLAQRQANMVTSNTQSTPISIDSNPPPIVFDLGIPSNPGSVTIQGIQLTYRDPSDVTYIVDLPSIKVHFVEQQSQQQNKKQQQKSSSQTREEAEQKQREQQQQRQEQQQRQQEQQQRQQEIQNQVENRLQNSQAAQDTKSLKQQMQKQIQEAKKAQQEFKENLARNQDFQQQRNQLTEQGFKQVRESLDPESNTTGNFSIDYENEQGELATLQGRMEEGELTELELDSPQTRQQLLEKIKQHPQFQQYDQQLQQQGFLPEEPTIISQEEGNKHIKFPYTGPENNSAQIIVQTKDEEIQEITLIEPKNSNTTTYLIIALVLLAILSIFLLRKLKKKQEAHIAPKAKPINYTKQAQKMLLRAQELFDEKKYKDAYGTAAATLKFYYSHKLGDKTELTNTQLLKLLRTKKVDTTDTKKALNLCGLVEFAKYKPNEKDFSAIYSIVNAALRKKER